MVRVARETQEQWIVVLDFDKGLISSFISYVLRTFLGAILVGDDHS